MVKNENDAYFIWLCGRVKGEYYSSLLDLLYSIPFEVKLNDLDFNRLNNGMKLREEFQKEVKIAATPSKKCTFFEMLLGLAIEMDDKILYEGRFGDRYLDWFWHMIDNMGFSLATDGNWNYSWAKEVKKTCNNIMNGRYEPNGEGGLFPVYNHPEADLRKVDIWRQAFWWIDENLDSGRIE